MKTAATAIVGLFLTMACVVSAKVHLASVFVDFPGFRFTEWNDLPSSMQGFATTLGYFADNWNNPGKDGVQNNIETKSFASLSTEEQTTLKDLGFYPYTWDCYMNHYEDLSWSDLEDRDMDDAAMELGFTETTWTSGPEPAPFESNWEDLTESQKWAAVKFCYWQDNWDESPITEWERLPIIYPFFRFVHWDELSQNQKTLAEQAGWIEETWNKPDSSDLEYTMFADLGDPAREALLKMGFYEEQYNCYINHYQGLPWATLVDWGLDEYFTEFGWTEATYPDTEPSAWSGDWDYLTDAQKDAADELCWFKELWDGTSHTTLEFQDYRVPSVRYIEWDKLWNHQQNLAATAGWTKDSWNAPGKSENLEKQKFDDLSPEKQDALRQLGFYTRGMYDCYVNHYMAVDWTDMGGDSQAKLAVFGWDESSWQAKDEPDAWTYWWDDLTEEQTRAARHFCWSRESWDGIDLPYLSGALFPMDRYIAWDDLGSGSQTELQSVGYTADDWNRPGDAVIESRSWLELNEREKDTLIDLGFYEMQWNCFAVHFSDFPWFLLQRFGVRGHFETLGWTKSSWEADDKPDAWGLDWDDLSDAQQTAAKGLCYFKEIWDEWKLSDWSDDVRSGASFYDFGAESEDPSDTDVELPPVQTEESDSGAGGGVIVALILVVVCVGVAYYCYRKRSKAKSIDHTYPNKGVPGDIAFTDGSSGDSTGSPPRNFADVDLDPADNMHTIT